LHASLTARLDRLAPEREVAQIGAAIGREFSYELLAAVARMPDDQLRPALEQLASAELVFARGTPPDATYTFKHALVQDAAYSSLLRARRQQLHAAVACVLEEREPERMQAQPELIAHHLTEAGQAEAAVRFWLKAGRRSAERAADREAVSHLRRGLEVLMRLPASVDRDRIELDFQLALGTPLISLHGWSGLPVAAAYERARALCEQLGDSAHLAPILFGLASNRVVGGQTRAALAFAQQCRSIADHTGDRVAQLLSHRAMGAALRQLGRLSDARTEFESILPLYDPELDRSLAISCITDPRISGLSLLSQVLWVMGFPAKADRTAREAFRCAAELGHTNTLGHVYVHAGAELGELRRHVPAAREHAKTVIDLAEKHHMRGWHGYGLVIGGWALALEGQTREGVESVRSGLLELDDLGTSWNRPHHLGLLAELYGRLGDGAAGLQVLEEAHDEIRRTEARFWEADLHRIAGELRLSGANQVEAEACFVRAIGVARAQGAKAFELRAVMSLARLWRDQGKSREAHDLLAPVYAWFTEGFDTPDLIEAGALLQGVSRHGPRLEAIRTGLG
jgi:predicted ATPase